MDDLQPIQELLADLQELQKSSFQAAQLRRLCPQLEASIDGFRNLLDKPSKSEKSRNAVLSGTIKIDDEEFSVNDEFKHGAIDLADTLDLDELEAARQFLLAQHDKQNFGRSIIQTAIIRFNQRREYLLESLRIVLLQSLDVDSDDAVQEVFTEVVRAVLRVPKGTAPTAFRYPSKCLSAMAYVKKLSQELAERKQAASVSGRAEEPGFAELLIMQQDSISRQHEMLGAIITHLIQTDNTAANDFQTLLSTLTHCDRYDAHLVHYLPVLGAFISKYGSPDGPATFEEAYSLHKQIATGQDRDGWALRDFQAAVTAWWLSEYSGRFTDLTDQARSSQVDSTLVHESARSRIFSDALKDGAFDLILCVCFAVGPLAWYNSSEPSLKRWLMKSPSPLLPESVELTAHFQTLLMEQLESFVESFITNMWSTARQLRSEGDHYRVQSLKAQVQTLSAGPEQKYDLEKFLLIMSFAFDQRPEAARVFWQDSETNVFGFLRWTSRRLSVPLACALCEVLLSLSDGEDNAKATHNFLLEEGAPQTGRLIKMNSMSWNQIFFELQHFVALESEPAPTQPTQNALGKPRTERPSINDPEVLDMLEAYLRLVTRLCLQSPEARNWLNNCPTSLLNILFSACSTTSVSRFRAAAFLGMLAFLPEDRDKIWSFLDQWISGGGVGTLALSKASNPQGLSSWTDTNPLTKIALDVRETTGFVRLLTALMSSNDLDNSLNDGLPFPEQLGSLHRMPGIEPFIDFVLGRIFAPQSIDFQDSAEQRLLRLRCLEFIWICLSSFNENLIIIANRSDVRVDTAMKATSLDLYVELHPFSRVMEWLLNEKVLNAVFSAIHQNVAELDKVKVESPLFQSVILGIQIAIKVLDIQATYVDIVRPHIEKKATRRRASVANSALVSFEDAILNNLRLIVDLGLFCDLANPVLTEVSLLLLAKITASPKFALSSRFGGAHRSRIDRILSVFEIDGDPDRILRPIISQLEPSPRELENRASHPSVAIKFSILSFLNESLKAANGRPSIAHLFLGFRCSGGTLEVGTDSLFSREEALFHAIIELAIAYPYGLKDNFLGWLMSLNEEALSVLAHLWRSPITSAYCMTELRHRDFLPALLLKQPLLEANSLFEGEALSSPGIAINEAASSVASFLQQRVLLFDYAAREIRLTSQQKVPSLKSNVISALLGTAVIEEGQVSTPSIFDLFDFIEIDLGKEISWPEFKFFREGDFAACLESDLAMRRIYDVDMATQVLFLRVREIEKQAPSSTNGHIAGEMPYVIEYLKAHNRRKRLVGVRLEVVRAWVRLLVIVIECCDLDKDITAGLILHAFQIVLPKLERYAVENAPEAHELARLSNILLCSLDFTSQAVGKSQAGDIVSDRLFGLFQISIHSLHYPNVSVPLRHVFYSICYKYLRQIADIKGGLAVLRKHSMHSIKASGQRLLEVICEDAYTGQGEHRISALLMLDAVNLLAQSQNSPYIVDTLVRNNFIGLMVETLKEIPAELETTNFQDQSMLFDYLKAKLSLLLRIAQTRAGAGHVIGASLFQIIGETGIFSAVPDYDADMDNPSALNHFYELLLWLLRLLSTVVLTRGAQNVQVINQAKRFLFQNRRSMVTLLKLQAKAGGTPTSLEGTLDGLVEQYLLLIRMTDFLKFEESEGRQRPVLKMFS
ncbi:MAG: hypothetical protein M1833_006860 [Piccolia ochrophora]|nr:MAG: hypothetical protein M1833_006860 [Piccolia ochrophora]